jgi:hypothetical protein
VHDLSSENENKVINEEEEQDIPKDMPWHKTYVKYPNQPSDFRSVDPEQLARFTFRSRLNFDGEEESESVSESKEQDGDS